MTTLAVRRLSATVHAADPRRVDQMLRALADRRLADALATAALPPGKWCVRRIDVSFRFDPDRPDSALEAEWARALVAALERALVAGSPEVVRYRDEADALADLVASVASGRLDRAWAWTRLGLLPSPAMSPAPAATIAAALERRPERALGALVTAVRRVGAAALDRALGPSGWTAVAAIVRTAVTGHDGPAAGHRQNPQWTVEAARVEAEPLARTLVRGSLLAEVLRRGRLRPDPVTAAAWAVLVVAEADPAVLRRPAPHADGVVAATATLVARPATPAPAVPRAQPAAEAASTPVIAEPARTPVPHPLADDSEPAPAGTGTPAGTAGHAASRPGARALPRPEPPATVPERATKKRVAPPAATPTDPEAALPEQRYGTAWAGLPFLLNTAEDAGLLHDPGFGSRTMRWVVHAVGRALVPVSDDDPAVLALAGLDPTRPPPSRLAVPASPAELAGITALADRWAAVTADRLGATGDPREIVGALAARTGHVVADPGWIDVNLSLDDVDVAVRRAGLDLDPGWVPWLGAVVRFVYA